MDPCLQFCHLLRHASCAVEKQLGSSLAHTDVTLSQAMLLLHVGEGCTTMSKVKDALCCSSGNVTQLAETLLKKKLIEQSPCGDDRRVQHLHLTPKGKKLLRTISLRLTKNAHACVQCLKPLERKHVTTLLKKM